jgi:hypothetical protein
MWRLCGDDYSNDFVVDIGFNVVIDIVVFVVFVGINAIVDSDCARRMGCPFNLHVTMPAIADEKMSPSDAEPSETTATTGCPARCAGIDGISA